MIDRGTSTTDLVGAVCRESVPPRRTPEGNAAIQNHVKDGRELHLFERSDGSKYTYLGSFECVGHRVDRGIDQQKQERDLITFDLKARS